MFRSLGSWNKLVAMGFIWGLFKVVVLIFAVIIAALVVIDGSLLANLFGKEKD